jgi:hypothetical protein
MRTRLFTELAGGLAAISVAMPAFAQPNNDGGGRAILFDQPNFQGTSITIVQGSPNLESQGFAGRAMSGHFDGDWTACDAANYRGHCQPVTGDVTDLAAVGLSRRLTSLRSGEPSADASDQDAPAPGAGERSGEDEYYDRGATSPARDETGGGGAQAPQTHATGAPAPVPDQGVAGHSVIFFVRPQHDGADVQGAGRQAADAFCRDQNLGPALYYDVDARTLRDVLCRRD